MDILRYVSESFWEWMLKLPIEFTGLFSRMALILILFIICGMGVKNIYQKGFRYTLPLQIASVILALVLGLTVRLGFIQNMTSNSRNVLLMAAFCCSTVLPIVSVRFIIRQKGIQDIAWKVIYGIELLLLIIQIIVCSVR
ncbi:MAG: hypothetical protein PHV82_15965 [Victivallaceae bacterium]|nr:hypothetical protein [Victivallaceae bacterium]